MRILIDHSGYRLLNIGDCAMLCMSIERLTQIFPTAEIVVVVENASSLKLICPAAIPLPYENKLAWLKQLELASNPWKRFRREFKAKLRSFIGIKKESLHRLFADEIATADLVVAAGGGYITDAFSDHAISVLRLLAIAKKMGRPVVMFGQGIGPVTNRVLKELLEQTLPQIDLICLREGLRGVEILQQAGVKDKKWLVTGDDAIELGYRLRQDAPGRHCGINLRLAAYSDAAQYVPVVCRVVSSLAEQKGFSLEPLPVSRHLEEDDAKALAAVFETKLTDPTGGGAINSVASLCRSISHCRIVVTGSYHAGVFALSQGIPVVGMAATPYYADKFAGLAEQFPGGVEIVDMSSAGLEETLTHALLKLWECADHLRPTLLKAAEKQIASGQAAYEHVRKLVRKP